MTLNELTLKHNTDKAPDRHNYARHYEEMFLPLKDKPISLLEIGVFGGASMNVWYDYFPNAMIYGIDLEERHKAFEKDRIKIFIGNQSDQKFLQDVVDTTGLLDVVIDDGSHNGNDQRNSFGFLYDYVKPGGLYIVEDLHTSYWGGQWGDSFVNYTKEILDEVIYPGGKGFPHGHGDPRNNDYWNVIETHVGKFSRQTKSIKYLSSMVVFERWMESDEYGPWK